MRQRFWIILIVALVVCGCSHQTVSPKATVSAGFLDAQTPAFKIYAVNYALYPYVMCYFRTMDGNKEPLINLTNSNVGLMVQGQLYDPMKKQYEVQTLKDRREGFRTVLVLDCSASMAGQPFADLLTAARSFIRLKSPSDEIGIIALTDSVEHVCAFTKDVQRLDTYLNDLRPIGKRTPLYDGIGTAIQACFTGRNLSFSQANLDFTVLSNIVVITDGIDVGSAMSKEGLDRKIDDMKIPIPIYSIIYNGKSKHNFQDLAYLSTISFGRYWEIDSMSYLSQICSKILDINRNDYVVTFRGYLPVDGNNHNLKIAIRYAGFFMDDTAQFQSINLPLATDELRRLRMKLENSIPKLPDGNPYYSSPETTLPEYGE
jgi:hypothetical protein